MVDCWICGDKADSREHLVKASDLRQTFGTISPQAPVYFKDRDARSHKVGSAKSRLFKSSQVLCQRCNSTRTQPFDKDWETLSAELARRSKVVAKKSRIKLRSLFPGRAREASTNIQLYFAKLFGCRIVDEDICMDIDPFKNAIECLTPCEGLTLVFCRDATHRAGRHAFVSEIQATLKETRVVAAGWTYALDRFFVEVMWFDRFKSLQGVKGLWRPDDNGNLIKIVARE